MKSTVGKVSAIMVMVTFLLASAFVLNVVMAENETIEMNITGFMIANNTTSNETMPIITLNNSIESNSTLNETVAENSNNETNVLENITNVTEDIVNISEGFVLGENLAMNDSVSVTLISNTTENTANNETSVETNETTQETNETATETKKPTFDLQLSYHERITRGEEIVITAELTSDVFARNVYLKWLLPIGFEIISGNAIETCGDLNSTVCISNISVITNNAGIGLRDIRIVVDYEE